MYLNKLLILKKLQQTNTHLGLKANRIISSQWSGSNSSRFPSYVFGIRASQPIIDIEKTLMSLRRAFHLIRFIMKSRGHLLFVNTNPQYNKIIQQVAKQTNQSFINHKWIGGFLTNWNHMQSVQKQFQTVVQYSTTLPTKKVAKKNSALQLLHSHSFERSLLLDTPRYKKMQKCFEGAQQRNHHGLSEKPDCVIIFHANQNSAAIREAFLNQIPIVSLVDATISNDLYHLITYPIPANCESAPFVYLFCNSLMKTILISQERNS